jgi:hypothetical protein
MIERSGIFDARSLANFGGQMDLEALGTERAVTAIDVETGSRDKAGMFGTQEQDGVGNLF